MTLRDSIITSVSRKFADEFMQQNEILQNVGLGVWHYGLIHRRRVVGVLSFGSTCFASNRGMLAEIAANNSCRIIQLCRGGSRVRAPKNTGSRMISLALKDIRDRLGPSIVVAYSNTRLGEIGTIYQASNAVYTGQTDPKGQANYRIQGELLSGWKVRKRYGTRDRIKLAKIDPNLEVIPLLPKHRYVFVSATRDVRKKVRNELMSSVSVLSYPKRHIENVKRMRTRRTRTRVVHYDEV